MLPLTVSWLPCVSKASQFLYLIQSSLNIQICNISYPMKKGICQHKKETHNTCRTLWNCHLLQIYFLKWMNSFMNESHKQQLKILGVWTLRSWKSLKFNQLLTMDTDVLYHIIFILWFRGRMKGYHESSLEHIYKILTKSSSLVKVSELQELTDCKPWKFKLQELAWGCQLLLPQFWLNELSFDPKAPVQPKHITEWMTTAISALFVETRTHQESIVKVIKKDKLSITNKKQENLPDPVCTRNSV